jgi:carboxylesterase
MTLLDERTRTSRWPGARDDIGVLVLHGLGSTVQSVRPLAEALADRGWPVSAPLLPGHGETVAAFARTGFPDWLAGARDELRALASRCSGTVVIGLSMGGALALTLAAQEPVLGVVAINPYLDTNDPALHAAEQSALAAGIELVPAPGDGDVRRPGAAEIRYQELPVSCLRSLFAGGRALTPLLPDIAAPLLVVRSRYDAVIGPEAAALLVRSVGGPVTTLELPHSAHVAPLDEDVDLLISGVLEHLELACLSVARPVALEQM